MAYQSRGLEAYARTAEVARQIGLISERDRLLIFNQLIETGPNAVARAAQTYAGRYPATAQDRPGTEKARISAFGDILKAQRVPNVATRVDTIVSGHGSIRGISFDLDQLGVSDAG